ncbi:MarR family transcriptional regulator [Paenibacillus sp. FSL H8-0548]|uniref:MarR family winged helix-turn-helix transcriptional regulator n=1 Tax=Paenibacillus sp. FSL H8-0548 TaxID=1920422 RepID=UPI00096CFFDC|nr:MarR family winged helix-turn-helix transcriptional regulator [Paenibacillus sp. FSL H8-0548]OMF18877.1 MarR family transcriptional regulator [Paenibacillus sp. FSL H8-0548]
MEKEIFKALIELVSIMNRPDRDKKMITNAGVNLEAATFRVLVGIAHLQSTSVGDLAAMMGKNYSSVSRQIDKLEIAGLVNTYPSSSDSRIRVSELTKYGEEINAMISLARERVMREALADWTLEEKNGLLNNLRRLFESLQRFD